MAVDDGGFNDCDQKTWLTDIRENMEFSKLVGLEEVMIDSVVSIYPGCR